MKTILGILFFCFSTSLFAQQTVGLFEFDSLSYPGYILLAGISSTDVYLIDNCGEVVHKWDLESRPGLMTYLHDDGTLIRTERIGSDFGAGGSGGRISQYDWEGQLIWRYDLSSSTYHQHHDIALLPNGNILAITWELFTRPEIIALGRDENIVNNDIWLEKIVELKPIGTDAVEEVWSWHLVDHLIQDKDSTKPNFGIISDHPEKVDLNFNGGGTFPLGGNMDWIHLNGIDYNAELDQIVVSSRHLSEFWIIDHSTTTAEAATSEGGDTGKGGDLLYRWGNPETYDRGMTDDRQSFLQHDATWMKYGDDQDWGVSIFNNGTGRPGPDFSQIDFIKLPINSDKTYQIKSNQAFSPITASKSITEIEDKTFFNNNISGAQVLPNGNTLICVGGSGTFFEVDTSTLDLVWHYISPQNMDLTVIQGNDHGANSTFKLRRYPLDFPAFNGKDLSPKGPLEEQPFDPLPNCESYGTGTSNIINSHYELSLAPNPAQNILNIYSDAPRRHTIYIFNSLGILVYIDKIIGQKTLDLIDFPDGVYFIKSEETGVEKFIIQRS